MTKAGAVEPQTDRVDGIIDALGQAWLVLLTDQMAELGPQRVRQHVREGREQHPRFGMGPCERCRPMQRQHGLAGASRARHAGRAIEGSLDQLPLLRVQEDRPSLPRRIQGALQLLDVGHDAEAALCIGVIEGVGAHGRRLRIAWHGITNDCQKRSLRSILSPLRA